MDETIFTAARRVIVSIQIDDNHGGLLSLDTIKAVQRLEVQLEKEKIRERSTRSVQPNDSGKTVARGQHEGDIFPDLSKLDV